MTVTIMQDFQFKNHPPPLKLPPLKVLKKSHKTVLNKKKKSTFRTCDNHKSNCLVNSSSPSVSTSMIKLAFLLLISTTFLTSQVIECLVEKWTVGIPGGLDEANRVASEHDCKNLGLVRGFNDVYLFEKQFEESDQHQQNGANEGTSADNARVHRTKRELEAHPFVTWVDPQTPQYRVKRDILSKPKLAIMQQQKQQLLNINMAQSQPQTHTLIAPAQPPPPQPAPQQQSQQNNPANNPSGGPPPPAPPAPPAPLSGFKNSFDRGMYASFSNNKNGQKIFNDELWSHQWYLQDSTNVAQVQSEVELKVEEVWRMGFTGKGIVVTILDDGLEWNHTDIYPNYDARASWDMNNNRSDPFPRYDSYDLNNHGTRCAGEVAMVANNTKCGVGVAPRAKIGGIKCLDGIVADHIESMSLLHNIDYIDIYSGSWGPFDDGKVVEGPKRLASQALERGTKYGRQGKGALYVWANGNGGAWGDHCNCDGYVNSIYTISIGGVTQQGQIPFYGERCASTLAVTCSSGAHTERKIVTTDLHNKCTIDYTGTSAAAPLAAGVYALVLEANNNLTWRDIQHLTIWTSNPIPIKDNPGWKRNQAGLVFNSRFGYGLLSAKAMVDAALNWKTVPKKSICIVSPSTRVPLFIQSRNLAQVVFISDGCQREYENQQQLLHKQQQQQQQQQSLLVSNQGRPRLGNNNSNNNGGRHIGATNNNNNNGNLGSSSHHQQPSPVNYLEHVQLVVEIEYTSRGALDIFLISPSGTVSTLLARRPLDTAQNGFDKWPFMSVHFWGELSHGKWTVIVRDKDSQHNRGMLRNATLILHGTTTRPAHMTNQRIYDDESLIQSFIDPISELDEDDIYDLNTFPNDMALVKDDSFQPTFIKSIIAMEQTNNKRA